MENNNIYGVVINGIHHDISRSLKATKKYATINNFLTVSIRWNAGYNVSEICHKYTGKWQNI